MNVTTQQSPPSLPRQLRRAGTRVYKSSIVLTSPLRALPDFMVVGVQRGGTTTLFRWLAQHPAIQMPRKKELHYFDLQSSRSLSWYRSHFPIAVGRQNQQVTTGEATPYYIFHPRVPERVAAALPRVKLIVLLRNPIDRAYSHYQHEVDHGDEPLSFAEAVAREPERLGDEEAKMLANPAYYSFNHQHYSYVARGVYVDQLQRWSRHFPRERMLVIKSEDLYANPATTMDRVTGFLELPKWEWAQFPKHNALEYQQMDPAMRLQLQQFYAPHNRRLYDYLGQDFGWDG